MKKVLSIWIGMYPVNVATSWVITMLPWWGGVAIPARSAIVVTVVAPIMTLVMMPAVTRLLAPWLRRRPEHREREAELCARLDALAGELAAVSLADAAGHSRSTAAHRYPEDHAKERGARRLAAGHGRSQWSDSTRWSSEPGFPA